MVSWAAELVVEEFAREARVYVSVELLDELLTDNVAELTRELEERGASEDFCSEEACSEEELSGVGLLLALLGWDSESAGAPPHADSMVAINNGKVHDLSFSTHLYIC